jgi:pimeloyl-ACP methyl ester carboxylesterase
MELFYRKFGNEGVQAVIILHGLFGISDNWVSYGKHLAEEGYEVFIPDQRNHGRSEHSDDFNYLALTNDLFDFIDAEEIENPILIGHSMGGKVAMRFAVSYPEWVKKLVIVDIAPREYGPRQHHLSIIKTMLEVDLSKMRSRTDVSSYLKKGIADERIRQFILKNLYRKNKKEFEWRLNLEAISDNLEKMFDSIQENKAYKGPVLFIKGGNSDYILSADYKDIYTFFPYAEIVTIEGATHWVHADEPDEFQQLTYQFLQQE